MKKIAALASGGDAPGMNACIRAVACTASAQDVEIWGVWDGYDGIVDRRIKRLTSRGVTGSLQRDGGPSRFNRILGTRTGVAVTEVFLHGHPSVLTMWRDNRVQVMSIDELKSRPNPYSYSQAQDHVHHITTT